MSNEAALAQIDKNREGDPAANEEEPETAAPNAPQFPINARGGNREAQVAEGGRSQNLYGSPRSASEEGGMWDGKAAPRCPNCSSDNVDCYDINTLNSGCWKCLSCGFKWDDAPKVPRRPLTLADLPKDIPWSLNAKMNRLEKMVDGMLKVRDLTYIESIKYQRTIAKARGEKWGWWQERKWQKMMKELQLDEPRSAESIKLWTSRE
jgi:ribosomal protein L37AE/L43A